MEKVILYVEQTILHLEKTILQMEKVILYVEKRVLQMEKRDFYIKGYKMGVKKTFAQFLSDTRLMTEGCNAHLDEVKAVGITESMIVKLEEKNKLLADLDTQQEKLKADLKSVTSKLTSELSAQEKLLNEARRRVKVGIATEQWREFGITASR